MSTQEMSDEFNLLYDNISSNSAPGIDQYEKSVYLTTAQFELVKTFYDGFNPSDKGFDGNEKMKRNLSKLIKDFKSTSFVTNSNGLFSKSKFVNLPIDLMYIIYESTVVKSSCGSDKIVEVIPLSYDLISRTLENPFKKAINRTYRLDISNLSTSTNVELVSDVLIKSYSMRYIKYPSPIILTDFELDPNLSGLGLKINGKNTITECELDESLHKEILNRAVELAIRDFRENNLQNKIQTDNRII